MKLTLFFVGSTLLLSYFKVVANPTSRISPKSPEKKKNIYIYIYIQTKQNKEKTAGLLDVILELRSSKLTSFEPK